MTFISPIRIVTDVQHFKDNIVFTFVIPTNKEIEKDKQLYFSCTIKQSNIHKDILHYIVKGSTLNIVGEIDPAYHDYTYNNESRRQIKCYGLKISFPFRYKKKEEKGDAREENVSDNVSDDIFNQMKQLAI